MLRGLFELLFLIVADIRHPALSEAIHEERPGSAPEKDNDPIAFGSSLPGSRNPLFDDPSPKIGVDLAIFGPSDGLTQD